MTTADATKHLAATNEILNALGRAGGAPDAVLDTIVDHAARLCRAQAAQIYLIDDGVFRLTRVSGAAPADFQDYIAQHPVALSRASLLGRVALDRRAQQIADVLSDPGYGRQDLQRLGGYRTLMSAPMLVDDDVVGVLGVWRTAVEPFDDRAMELLGVFAAQAALAIRNVSLLRDLQARRSELARKVEQLELLSEVGQAVSSSLDLDEVLHTIVTNAVRLTGTDGGSIMEYVDEQECFSVRAAHGSSDELAQRLRQIPIERSSTLVGRAAAEGLPLEVPDLGRRRHSTPISRRCTTTDGGRSSPCPCCARDGPSARSSSDAGARVASATRHGSCCRPWRASQGWRSSTPGCSGSWRPRPPSSRSRAGTSRSSSPACRTSSARR